MITTKKISDAVKELFNRAVTYEFDTTFGELRFIKIQLVKDTYGEMFDWLNAAYGHRWNTDPNHPDCRAEITIEADVLKYKMFVVYPAYFTTNADNDIIATFRVASYK